MAQVIAALFPGQGSQVIGMARELYDSSAAAKRVLDEAERAVPGLLSLMWEGSEETLQLTANQQPALVAAGSAAFAAYLEAGGTPPAYAAGHSLGEFSAHVAAGSLSVADAVQLVRKRGSYMQEAVPEGEGAMAAVLKLEPERVRQLCEETEGVVEIANLNSPEQTVISGAAAAVEAAGEKLKAERARVVPLKVSAPFHCRLMQPAADKLAQDLAQITFSTGKFPVLSNVSADIISDHSQIAGLLEQQVISPVRWTEIMQRLHSLGVTTFLEFGSGKVLSGLIKRTLGDVIAHSITDSSTLKEAL